MQNISALSRGAMFYAECVTGTGTGSRLGTIPPDGEPDRSAVWGAGVDRLILHDPKLPDQ